jgi:hypothetical protein
MASSGTAGDEADGYHSATSAECSHSSGTLHKRDYLYLSEAHCRCTMSVRVGKVPLQVVCFGLTSRCGYHLRQRTDGEGRLPAGGYLAFQPPGKSLSTLDFPKCSRFHLNTGFGLQKMDHIIS